MSPHVNISLESLAEDDLLLAMGIRFWFKVMASLEITQVEQCRQLLENLDTIVESKEAYSSVFGANIGAVKDRDNDSFEQRDIQSSYALMELKDQSYSENVGKPEIENFLKIELHNSDQFESLSLVSELNNVENNGKIVETESQCIENAIVESTELEDHASGLNESVNITPTLDLDEVNDISNMISETLNSEQVSEKPNNLDIIKGRKHKCEFCDFQVNLFNLLRRHTRDEHHDEYNNFLKENNLLIKFECEYCKTSCRSFKRLKSHVIDNHKGSFTAFEEKYKKHKCSICKELFFSKESTRHHERKSHGLFKTERLTNGKYKIRKPRIYSIDDELPFYSERKCEECDRTFKSLNIFSDHIRMHKLGGKPYMCEKCKSEFLTRKHWKLHIKKHVIIEDGISCEICFSQFQTVYDFGIHKKKEHTNHIQKQLNNKVKSKDIICTECGKLFKSDGNYRHHFAVVHSQNEYVCEICSYKSKTLYGIRKHKDIHSTAEIPCNKCEKVFKSTYNLERHVKNVHTHIADRPYQCTKCKKGFSKRKVFEDHQNIHIGIKPYSCNICDTKFSNVTNKFHHIRNKHGRPSAKKTKSPVKTQSSPSRVTVTKQEPVVCKKRKGTCNHEIISDKHYKLNYITERSVQDFANTSIV